jgi:glycosyltransferase involved in cell wall biosynthesis
VDGLNPQIVVAHLGARMHYSVPAVLERAGMLAQFFTDAYVGPGSAWQGLPRLEGLLPMGCRPGGLQRLLGRREDALPPEKVTAFNLFGVAYWLAQRRAGPGASLERVYLNYGRRFAEKVRRHPRCAGQGVYTLLSMARPLFQQASRLGMKCILDQFIAPWKITAQILKEEQERWPGWELPSFWAAPSHDFLEVEEQEQHLADGIICPSEFVAQGLKSLNIPAQKIFQVPYGLEGERFSCDRRPWHGQRPLHLLFLGGVNLRKGLPYLYQALKRLNTTRIISRLVGPVAIQEPHRSLLSKQAEITGLVPRTEVQRHYAWADVFVFPSLCEGSAMVTYEALAAGLPVITTPNTGSVVRDGREGFVVPIRNPEALAARIDLMAADPELVAQMSHAARQRSREFSWPRYGARLVSAVQDILAFERAAGA